MLIWKPGGRKDLMGRRRRAWFSDCGRYKVSESKMKDQPRRFYALVRDDQGNWSHVELMKTYRTERTAKRACEKHARQCDQVEGDLAAAGSVTKRRKKRRLPAFEEAGLV